MGGQRPATRPGRRWLGPSCCTSSLGRGPRITQLIHVWSVAKVAAWPAGRVIVGRPFLLFSSLFSSFRSLPRPLVVEVVGWKWWLAVTPSRFSASVPAVRSLAAGGVPAAALEPLWLPIGRAVVPLVPHFLP